MNTESRNALLLALLFGLLLVLATCLPMYVMTALPMQEENPTTFMRREGGRAEAAVLLQVIVITFLIMVPFGVAAALVQGWYIFTQPKTHRRRPRRAINYH